jgi:thiamine biosynthesis protein ThiS
MIRVIVNNASQELADSTTIVSLLEQMKFDPKRVAVEVNRRVVPKSEHSEHRLSSGDSIEIVTLVGGG